LANLARNDSTIPDSMNAAQAPEQLNSLSLARIS